MNWYPASFDIDAVFEVIFDQASPSNAYLCTYDEGVFQSINSGESLSEMNTGLDDLYVRQLAMSSDDYLYAGTHQISVYRYYCQTGISGEPGSEQLPALNLEFSPNPCFENLRISYCLPFSTMVEMDVYDLNGRLIAEIEKESGSGNVEEIIDISGFVSRIYFCRLTAGLITETRAFAVVR